MGAAGSRGREHSRGSSARAGSRRARAWLRTSRRAAQPGPRPPRGVESLRSCREGCALRSWASPTTPTQGARQGGRSTVSGSKSLAGRGGWRWIVRAAQGLQPLRNPCAPSDHEPRRPAPERARSSSCGSGFCGSDSRARRLLWQRRGSCKTGIVMPPTNAAVLDTLSDPHREIVLTSRTDSARARLVSCAIASIVAASNAASLRNGATP